MSRLVDTNPELFENPTLGEATTNPFLDQVEEQRLEDRNARAKGREPRVVIAEGRFPKFISADSVPSSVKPELVYIDSSELDFLDEDQLVNESNVDEDPAVGNENENFISDNDES